MALLFLLVPFITSRELMTLELLWLERYMGASSDEAHEVVMPHIDIKPATTSIYKKTLKDFFIM